jgi:hypothetical protein
VPSIITRGGDAHASDPGVVENGGDGGNVTITALNDGAADPIYMTFQGADNSPAHLLPVPPPYHQMPIITAMPSDPPISTTDCLRPTPGQQLPLGRLGGDPNGVNIGNFTHGILTVGGIGGSASAPSAVAAAGGNGGNIIIANAIGGWMSFDNPDFFSGAGVEGLCYLIYLAGPDVNQTFPAPSGGLGAKGALDGGVGGNGGAGGTISLSGTIASTTYGLGFPPALAGPPTRDPVWGHHGQSPLAAYASTEAQIGAILHFQQLDGPPLFSTDSTGGSGGVPGGGTNGTSMFNGLFGHKGADGVMKITTNGTTTQYYP